MSVITSEDSWLYLLWDRHWQLQIAPIANLCEGVLTRTNASSNETKFWCGYA